jgi:hypothetical protein
MLEIWLQTFGYSWAGDFHMDSGMKYLIESFYRSIRQDAPVPFLTGKFYSQPESWTPSLISSEPAGLRVIWPFRQTQSRRCFRIRTR